jgi:hypothetical protein
MRGIVGRSGISMNVLGHSNAVERLRDNIRTVFPDDAFLGSVTPVDRISEKVYDDVLGLDVELYDDQQALYGSLHRRRWSEIPASFINSNPDGIVLLTNETFVAFLPAWLTCALTDKQVREFMVYTFSPEPDKPSERMDSRMLLLTSQQKKALLAFLAHCVEVESSKFIKEHARTALAYVDQSTQP